MLRTLHSEAMNESPIRVEERQVCVCVSLQESILRQAGAAAQKRLPAPKAPPHAAYQTALRVSPRCFPRSGSNRNASFDGKNREKNQQSGKAKGRTARGGLIPAQRGV